MNPFITLFFSFLAGSLAGLATGILNTKLQIPGILAGILTMIALYSINIRVMGGRPNIPLLGMATSLTIIQNILGKQVELQIRVVSEEVQEQYEDIESIVHFDGIEIIDD